MSRLNPAETDHLLATVDAASNLFQSGQLPFAARLVDQKGRVVLETENEAQKTGDPTAHAEIVLIREAARRFAHQSLAQMTVYTAFEPCGMCGGALIFCGIGRIVYGASAARLVPHLALPPDVVVPGINGRTILDATEGGPEVVGPVLEATVLDRIFGSPNE